LPPQLFALLERADQSANLKKKKKKKGLKKKKKKKEHL